MMPNLLQYPVAMFGALRAGLTVVNCNPLYTPRELEHQLKDSGATSIVVLENFAHTLQQVIARTAIKSVITTQVGDLLPLRRRCSPTSSSSTSGTWSPPGASKAPSASRTRSPRAEPRSRAGAAGPRRLAFLQYTGGTTGVAKGAMLTHGNMVANLQQVSAWVAMDLTEGAETTVIPLPLYHILSLTVSMIFFKIGAHLVLITNPRDLPAFVNDLRKVKFTAIVGVNTLFNALLDTPGFRRRGGARAQAGFCRRHGGAARGRQALGSVTGAPLIEATGLLKPLRSSPAIRSTSRTGPVPSGFRFRRRRSAYATKREKNCRLAASARSACAGPR